MIKSPLRMLDFHLYLSALVLPLVLTYASLPNYRRMMSNLGFNWNSTKTRTQSRVGTFVASIAPRSASQEFVSPSSPPHHCSDGHESETATCGTPGVHQSTVERTHTDVSV